MQSHKLAWTASLVANACLAATLLFITLRSSTQAYDNNLELSPSMKVGTVRSVVANAERFRLDNLSPQPGSRHRAKRLGRGYSAGQGGSAGKGMRGQNSRSGGGVRTGFEGGQTPLYRRLPKYPGRPMGPGHSYTRFGVVKLDYLNKMPDNSVVDYPALRKAGVMTDTPEKIHKVLGGTELTAKGLTVRAHAVSESARQAIEENGGTIELLPISKHFSYEKKEKKALHPNNRAAKREARKAGKK